MFDIQKVDYERVYPVFPMADDGYLHDYKDSSIVNCLSTLGVESVLTNGCFTLGDSGVSVQVTDTGKRLSDGSAQMQVFAGKFVDIAKEALDSMSADYKAFYEFMIKDYETNGLQFD